MPWSTSLQSGFTTMSLKPRSCSILARYRSLVSPEAVRKSFVARKSVQINVRLWPSFGLPLS